MSVYGLQRMPVTLYAEQCPAFIDFYYKKKWVASRGGVLDPHALLDIKSTLISCRELKKAFEKRGNLL